MNTTMNKAMTPKTISEINPAATPAAILEISPHSGSYLPSDVTLLLDIVTKASVTHVPVAQKEALIQTGQQHYSDMLTLEQPPTPTHEHLYQQALQQGKKRTASDIQKLSATLCQFFKDKVHADAPLILVSLVRAGLPIGVLLQRALSDSSCKTNATYPLPSRHYGVSIIRDRGLDPVALHKILRAHPNSPIVFVDGWTGKGAIYGELVRSLDRFNNRAHPNFANIYHQGAGVIPLLTLADPAGVAWLSASSEDWLIPSGLLGSTVSGLISRTLFCEPSHDLQAGLHQSVMYHNLAGYDHSLAFVDTIDSARRQLGLRVDHQLNHEPSTILPTYAEPRYHTQSIISMLAARYQVSNPNRIKPTIAEATRAVMRREPDKVLLATSNHPDTQLLRHLCAQKQVAIEVVGATILPYQAVTIISKRA